MAPASRREISHTRAHPTHRSPRRPPLQVEDTLPRPLPDRPAHALTQVTPEKVETLPTTREVDHSRLLRMQLKPEPREHVVHATPRFLDLRLRIAHHHEVIGIADQRAQSCALGLPYPVEDVQVDVGQQRRDHAPYAKGNFQFERVIASWRAQPVLDLRRK